MKKDAQISATLPKERQKLHPPEELKILQELGALQMETINAFMLINEKIKYSALNVFLLQSLTQSKALWEEINQLILIHLGENNVLKTIHKITSDAAIKLQSDIENREIIDIIKSIKLFEEYTISYYERVIENFFSSEVMLILNQQLEALHTRYQRLLVLEKKVKPE